MIQIIITGKDKERIMGLFDNDREYRAIGRRLDKLEDSIVALTALIIKQGKEIMAKADDLRAILNKLTADVGSQTTEIGGMKQLLTNLGAIIADLNQRIKDADNIPADIVQLAQSADDAVNNNTGEIVKAVADNTPSAGQT